MNKCAVVFAGLLLASFSVWAQNTMSKSANGTSIATIVPDEAGLSAGIEQILLNKMMQISSQHGLEAMEERVRFAMVPVISILPQDVAPQISSPIALSIELSLYIVDAMSQNILSQTTIALKGVGDTQEKACSQALSNLNPRQEQFKVFVEEGKEQILAFYNTQCDVLITASQALAAQQEYEEALFLIMSVPDVSSDCYQNSLLLSADIYKNYADKKCEEYLAEATAAWAAKEPGGVAENLGKITPDMDCYPQAQELLVTVTSSLKSEEAGLWDFEMKTYDDQIDLQRLRIESGRDLAQSWAQWGAAKYFDWSWLYKY